MKTKKKQLKQPKPKKKAKVNYKRCPGCGYGIHPSEQFCGECMVEDDSGL